MRLPSDGPTDGGGYFDLLPHMEELEDILAEEEGASRRYKVHRWARRWYGWQCGHDNPCDCDCACCRRRRGRAA